jgi:sugar lactone lactonase YvrE
MAYEPTVLLDGLVFPEGPRWRDGKLWFSDMHAHWVMTVDMAGNAEKVVEVPQRPSGLGWLPDGRLLVVSMQDRRLLVMGDGALRELADLTPHTSGDINDMVVDGKGRAYIGNFGGELSSPQPTTLVMVTPEGQARVVADGLVFPNGTVITPDGRTLIVAETFGQRLTAFDVAEDGSLSGRRVWAELGEAVPDGICLDAEGAVWVASPFTSDFRRVREGGEVIEAVPVPGQFAVACMLGGEDRRTLFLLIAETTMEQLAQGISNGWIETVRVEVPGAGWP